MHGSHSRPPAAQATQFVAGQRSAGMQCDFSLPRDFIGESSSCACDVRIRNAKPHHIRPHFRDLHHGPRADKLGQRGCFLPRFRLRARDNRIDDKSGIVERRCQRAAKASRANDHNTLLTFHAGQHSRTVLRLTRPAQSPGSAWARRRFAPCWFTNPNQMRGSAARSFLLVFSEAVVCCPSSQKEKWRSRCVLARSRSPSISHRAPFRPCFILEAWPDLLRRSPERNPESRAPPAPSSFLPKWFTVGQFSGSPPTRCRNPGA